MKPTTTITRLDSTVQRYAWGSRTAIPDLLGLPNPDRDPWAEMWIGAHPKAPSRLVPGQEREGLDDAIARAPEEILGAGVAERFGSELPFLLKILAASEPLSIQCHPDAARARSGFDEENRSGIPIDAPHRNYRDPNHKPELIVAVTPFHALHGFRPVEQIRRLLTGIDGPRVRDLWRALDGNGSETEVESCFRKMMSLPAKLRAEIADEANRKAARARDRSDGPDRAAYAWVVRLHERYPGDIGVLSPLLLNLVVLERDEGLYLGAGTLHAYLGGLGVEIMANSDNVLRGGLTPKHIDVPELLRVTVFDCAPVEVIRPEPAGPGERAFSTPAEEFRLSIVDLDDGTPYSHPATGAVEILLVAEGRAEIRGGDGSSVSLTGGQSAVVPASTGDVSMRGQGRIFRARVGRPRRSGRTG